MLDRIGEIRNPLLRSLVVAGMGLTTATIVAGVAIGLTNPKAKDATYKVGIYTALIAGGASALVGLFLKSEPGQTIAASIQPTTEPETGFSSQSADQGWKDWRNFVVARKVKESEEITSFYLKPQDGGSLPKFQPGQFLTIKLEIPGQVKPVIRTYSLSDYPDPWDYYRLSIKREGAPKDLDVPPGVASNFMHDHVQEGTVIPAKPPSGRFVLDVNKTIPAILISNGVGITPMISMAKACTQLNPHRPVWFFHGARDGQFHAFREDVLAIAQQNPNLTVHYRYSRPRPEDEGHYHSTGYVDAALLRELVPQESEFFLCGSPSFMKSLRDGLAEWGVPSERVFFEAFSKDGKAAMAEKPATAPADGSQGTAEIVFARSGQTLHWKPGDGTILEFAEANDLNPEFSCRQGICLTCMCRIQEGEVAYQTPPVGTPDAGSVLICISQPKTQRVVLDL